MKGTAKLASEAFGDTAVVFGLDFGSTSLATGGLVGAVGSGTYGAAVGNSGRKAASATERNFTRKAKAPAARTARIAQITMIAPVRFVMGTMVDVQSQFGQFSVLRH
jgi:hypothetical protein